MQPGRLLKIVAVNGQLVHATDPGQLPSGEVVYYDAVVSATWTNALPPLPPLSQQFSVAANGKG